MSIPGAIPASRFSWLVHVAENLRKRRGFRRLATAAAYGVLCAFAYSPIDAVPALWIGFPALIFLLQGTPSARSAFFTGWSFAFGFLVFDLYWTTASLFVDIGHFWWVVPLALFALPAMFAIYYGVAAAIARAIGLNGIVGVMGFALCWFLADYARGNFFSGFPWNIEGYVWADFLPMLQSASVVGIYGLTLLTVVSACLPAILGDKHAGRWHRGLVAGLFIVLFAGGGWGAWRVATAPSDYVANVRLRLVQPDVDQQLKWKESQREKNFARLLELSSAPGEKPVTAIIWPETAAPFYLVDDTEHRREVAAITPPNGSVITGVLRHIVDPLGASHYFNSLIAIDSYNHIEATYDKAHLVPFGEYVPYRDILPIPQIAGMGIDFSHGPGAETIRTGGLPPFSPLICYEAIFPNAVVDRADPPHLLINVTNDGWYGNTAGPYQHFAIARVRAVEEGIPLVRAANTGISGIVDSYGRIQGHIGLGQRGFLDGNLPQPTPKKTLFRRWGETPVWLIFAALAAMTIFGKLVTKNKRKQ